MARARKFGIPTPTLYLIDEMNRRIYMEYLGNNSFSVKEFLRQLGSFDHPSIYLKLFILDYSSWLTSWQDWNTHRNPSLQWLNSWRPHHLKYDDQAPVIISITSKAFYSDKVYKIRSCMAEMKINKNYQLYSWQRLELSESL